MTAPVTQDALSHIGSATASGAVAPEAVPNVELQPAEADAAQVAGHASAGCTQAQLRRFIKSRPYVPMHELRRRFELNGQPDDVTPIPGPDGVIYVGLPSRESTFVAELLRQGDIGVELCHDPKVPIIMGIFAMRPVTR